MQTAEPVLYWKNQLFVLSLLAFDMMSLFEDTWSTSKASLGHRHLIYRMTVNTGQKQEFNSSQLFKIGDI